MTDDAEGRGRLPGEGQRPVRAAREHRVPSRWWWRGGLALVVASVVALSVMMATSQAWPVTIAVLVVAIPVGLWVAWRGFAMESRGRRRAPGRTSPRGDADGRD